MIDKDTSLKNVVVTVNDCGQPKMIQQYYASEYTRKDYTPPNYRKSNKGKKRGIVALTTGEHLDNVVKDKGTTEIDGLTYKVENWVQ